MSASTRRISLTKSLDDPLFGGQVPRVETDGGYWIEYDGLRTEEFRVSVFDYPELLRADATVTFPAYSGLAQTVIEDTV